MAALRKPIRPASVGRALLVALAAYGFARATEAFERLAAWAATHESLHVGESIFVILALASWVVYRERKNGRELVVQLRQQALTDGLTGLPNRTLLVDRLDHALAKRRDKTVVGLLYLDIDDFKDVNDELGHVAGDELLREAARRIRARLRDYDTVARVGGDELIVLVEDIAPPEIEIVADRVCAAFATEFELNGQARHVTASVGAALAFDNTVTAVELVDEADAAMYDVKRKGGGKWALSHPSKVRYPMIKIPQAQPSP